MGQRRQHKAEPFYTFKKCSARKDSVLSGSQSKCLRLNFTVYLASVNGSVWDSSSLERKIIVAAYIIEKIE